MSISFIGLFDNRVGWQVWAIDLNVNMLENYKNKFHCSELHRSFMIFHCLSRFGNLPQPNYSNAPTPCDDDGKCDESVLRIRQHCLALITMKMVKMMRMMTAFWSWRNPDWLYLGGEIGRNNLTTHCKYGLYSSSSLSLWWGWLWLRWWCWWGF